MPHRPPRRALLLLLGALGALSLFSSTALASSAPTVTVGSADNIFLTSATVHGTVNPNGAETTYKVEYGKTKAYGQNTLSFSAKSGESPVPFNLELFGLDALSTYHYRVSATNSNGTTLSSDSTFENRNDWTVEGTPVSNMLTSVHFQDNYKEAASEGGYIEISGPILGVVARFYCQQSSSVSGVLGVEITGMNFNNNCIGSINGVNNGACQPNGISVSLNGDFAFAATTVVNTSEQCFVGERLPFKGGGFRVEPGGAEGISFRPYIGGSTWFAGLAIHPWDIAYSPGRVANTTAWQLSGTNAGKKFGVRTQ